MSNIDDKYWVGDRNIGLEEEVKKLKEENKRLKDTIEAMENRMGDYREDYRDFMGQNL